MHVGTAARPTASRWRYGSWMSCSPFTRRRRVLGALLVVTAAAGPLGASAVSQAAPAAINAIRAPGATATELAVRVAAPPPPPTETHFLTLAPGSPLPSDAACASAVRPAQERRPANQLANHTVGIGPTDGYPRVTGNFTGTTDELIQWTACKWGIDEDVVRAQIAKESWWHQDAGGDKTTDPNLCHPLVRSPLPCPESVGLGQVRYRYHMPAFANANAIKSSAYNLDYTYAVWRSCFEGELGWLNTVERGATYAAGDMWGCLGVWLSGRWYVQAAKDYIAAVQEYLTDRIWETPGFQGG
jgi:hypothetical protein